MSVGSGSGSERVDSESDSESEEEVGGASPKMSSSSWEGLEAIFDKIRWRSEKWWFVKCS